MFRFFLFFLLLLNVSCGRKSQVEKIPDNPNPINSSLDFSISQEGLFFGMVNINRNSLNRAVIVTATQATGEARITIESTGDTDDFLITPSGCQARFSVGQICALSIRFSPLTAGLKSMNVKITSVSGIEKNVTVEGIGANYDSRVSQLRTELFNAQGSNGDWNDSISFDFFLTQYIAKTLLQIDKKVGLPGLFTITQDGMLDRTQNYLSVDDGGNVIDFATQEGTFVSKWGFPRGGGSSGLYVREVPYTLLDVLDLIKEKNSFTALNYQTEYSRYVDSRRILASEPDAVAQYSYYVSAGSARYGSGNYHRVVNDVAFLLDSLVDRGDTYSAERFSRAIFLNHDFPADHLRSTGAMNMSYNDVPFNYAGIYSEVSQNYSVLNKVYGGGSIDCRIHGQALLVLAKAYKAGSFTAVEAQSIIDELTFEWNNFNTTHGPGYLSGACKPIRARVVANLPTELRTHAEINAIYQDLLTEIGLGTTINQSEPFLMAEALKAIEELLYY